MTLNAEEMRRFKQLEAKRLEVSPPVTEEELEQMELRLREVMGVAAMDDLSNFWKNWCKRFHKLANDNTRLIAEIRRFNEERQEQPSSEQS